MTGRRRTRPVVPERRAALDIERVDDPQPGAPAPVAPVEPFAAAHRIAAAPFASRVELAAGFPDAGAALACAGHLIGVYGGDCVRAHSRDGEWWLTMSVELDHGRSAVHAAGGVLYALVDGRFTRDRGFGRLPTAVGRDAVEPDSLAELAILELLREAGLRPIRGVPRTTATLLLPARVATGAMRRALDIGLAVSFQPVRLAPLFGDAGAPADGHPVARVDLSAPDGVISPTLLDAFGRLPLTLVARQGGPDRNVLLQHRRASPMPDAHLAALVEEGGSWVLADAAFGCWRLTELAGPQDAADLVMAGPGYRLRDVGPPAAAGETLVPPVVRVVADRAANRRSDAMLLTDAELGGLAALLEGHPLADLAEIVHGDTWHLVLAPGGLLETFPIGQPLTCIGPGLLYIGRGRRLSPELPPAARRRLFTTDPEHAIVLLGDRGLRFRIGERRPVWSLWAVSGPPMETQLPADTALALAALDPRPLVRRMPTVPWRRPAGDAAHDSQDELLRQAIAAEAAGDLVAAAELHRRRGDPYRAGTLYERAAEQGM
ncbi:hypothetical protein ACIBSW_13485 [Actinoplanes sp. NPDC049668]|uniref:hypothetical protein n=1 Tax=unclassified Actinoplanes TaxID=2626549 RepID=UPI0033AC2A98